MVVEAGLTEMASVVAPVLQRYVPPPVAVRVAEAPAQMVPSLLAVPEFSVTAMAGVGKGFTVMVREAVPVQPIPLVMVTVYVVVIIGVTLMICEVAPVLHA